MTNPSQNQNSNSNLNSNTSKPSPAVRVRFAPSPTGYLHVGGARTALYNWLFAKKNKGQFILRIEDTDEARSTEDSLRGVIEDLKWLGLDWDEGPHPETLQDMGPYGPYKQSQRLEIYAEIAQGLLKSGQAYYCFLKDDEIEKQREQARAEGRSPHVQSPYQDWPIEKAQEKLKSGERAVVRFKTKNLKKDYQFKDLIRGDITFPSDMVGDFVLLRSDGMPVYNFCCAVDDEKMKISHVIRAEEHLPNTLRQLMIYEACGWQVPEFGHVSLVLDDDRQKLSKRKGAVSCTQFKNEGYLPSAINNFMALLGWSHPNGQEVLSLNEMIDGFSLDRIHPSGAIFDRVKLKWMNSMHLRALPEPELWLLVEPFLKEKLIHFEQDKEWQSSSLRAFKPYMEILSDAVALYAPLDDEKYEISEESREVLSWDSTFAVLSAWKVLIEESDTDFLTEEQFLKIQDEVKVKAGAKGKFLFMPIRVAVIGKPHGTELKILVPLMNKKSLLDRAQKVITFLNK
ncbi:MAG TPA: glutamate--tRNA ligase [Pseudobdellovibrionaceae bacterium]|nr:glutamate--tRNA ligase [Pseudobdellovibrionaceae bacterium]